MPKRLSPAVASLDATDRAILAALADDARIATSELARQIGLSAPRPPTACGGSRRKA